MKPSTNSRIKRRALLGAISTAGVVGAAKLPGQWSQPIVDHVLLPAHAATTDDTGASGTFVTTVTSNCVVTCTSARSAVLQDFSSTASGIWLVFRTYYAPYTQCSDSMGGFTSSFLSSASTVFTMAFSSSLTSFYSGSGSVSFTSNVICNVTSASS